MKHVINAAVTTSLALFATSAFAEGELTRPRYNFAELDYVYGVVQPQSDSLSAQQNNDNYYVPESAEVRGSWVFYDELLVRGSYYTGSGKYKSTNDIDSSSLLVSAGWLPPTADSTGIDISFDYRADNFQFDRKKNKLDEDINGPGISVGVRTSPFQNTEFGVRLGWYEGDYDGAVGVAVNAAYDFADNWGVNVFWENISADSIDSGALSSYELNKWGIGGRYYF